MITNPTINALLSVALLFSLSSCDNKKELTRERALAILKQTNMRDKALTVGGGSLNGHPSQIQQPDDHTKFIIAAEADGLIKIGTGVVFANTVWEPHATDKATEFRETSGKGMAFVSQHGPGRITKFIMAIPEPVEITNIGAPSQMGGKTVSIVNFKILYNPTPFGVVFARATGKQNEFAGRADAQASFALFDDGWHLEQWERQ